MIVPVADSWSVTTYKYNTSLVIRQPIGFHISVTTRSRILSFSHVIPNWNFLFFVEEMFRITWGCIYDDVIHVYIEFSHYFRKKKKLRSSRRTTRMPSPWRTTPPTSPRTPCSPLLPRAAHRNQAKAKRMLTNQPRPRKPSTAWVKLTECLASCFPFSSDHLTWFTGRRT